MKAVDAEELHGNRRVVTPGRIVLQRALPDFLEPYAHARCNIIGTLGNHELDEGATELLRLLTGGNHGNGPFLEERWHGAARD